MTFETDVNALAEALYLSVTAPTDEQSSRALKLAETLSAGLSEFDVERAKKIAETRLSGLPAPVTALMLSDAVYDALRGECEHFAQPDGVQVIKVNGYALRIFDDTDDGAPYGISWWIDSPEERGAVSDGWEILRADRIFAEAVTLAKHFRRQADLLT